MKGAMAFLAGMGTGYIKSKDKEYDRARQEEKDKRDQTLFDSQMEKINQDKADRAAMAAVESEAATPAYSDAQDIERTAKANARDASGAPIYNFTADDQGNVSTALNPQAVLGAAPEAYTPSVMAKQGVSYLGKAYDKPLTNEQAAEARRTRMADLAMQGNTFASTALRDNVQTEAAMGQLKEQKDLQGQRELGRSVATAAQTGGWKGVAQMATEKYNDGNSYKAEEDGKGGAIVISTGKDGKEIGRMPFKSLEEYITFAVSRGDPMKWVDYKTGRDDKATAQANTDRAFELQKKESESTADYRRRSLGIQAAQEARAGALHKITMEDAKIPPAVKLQATTLAKQMEGIGNALNKAMAEDNFNPQSANARALLEKQSDLGIQYSKLLEGFVPAAKTNLGIPDASAFDKKPAAAPITTPAASAKAGVVTAPPAPPKPIASNAPTRSIDGGKTWTLAVPDKVRDPSVPYYREIPNPMAVLGKRSFASRQEAEAAFLQMNK